MNPPPKQPRSDSPIRNLPEARQAEIIALLKTRRMSDVRAQLEQEGFKISMASLSDFRRWWYRRQEYLDAETAVRSFLEELRKDNPELTEERIASYGRRAFSLMALQNGSALEWCRVQSGSRPAAPSPRFSSLVEDAKKILRNPALMAEQQLVQLRQLFGVSSP